MAGAAHGFREILGLIEGKKGTSLSQAHDEIKVRPAQVEAEIKDTGRNADLYLLGMAETYQHGTEAIKKIEALDE